MQRVDEEVFTVGNTTMAGDLMQQARELLAAEYSKIGNTFRAEDIRNGRVNSDEHLAINAVRAALSATYVLR